jgi:hypothetical protein
LAQDRMVSFFGSTTTGRSVRPVEAAEALRRTDASPCARTLWIGLLQRRARGQTAEHLRPGVQPLNVTRAGRQALRPGQRSAKAAHVAPRRREWVRDHLDALICVSQNACERAGASATQPHPPTITTHASDRSPCTLHAVAPLRRVPRATSTGVTARRVEFWGSGRNRGWVGFLNSAAPGSRPERAPEKPPPMKRSLPWTVLARASQRCPDRQRENFRGPAASHGTGGPRTRIDAAT